MKAKYKRKKSFYKKAVIWYPTKMRKDTLLLDNTKTDKERLLSYARETPGAYTGLKIAALLLLLEGRHQAWITRSLGLTRQSLNMWIHRVNEEGLKGLQSKPRPGRPTRLKPDIQNQLKIHMEQSPSYFGLQKEQWDGPTLVLHLKRTFGVNLKVRQAQYWIRRLRRNPIRRVD